jgi:hypothetical protein
MRGEVRTGWDRTRRPEASKRRRTGERDKGIEGEREIVTEPEAGFGEQESERAGARV